MAATCKETLEIHDEKCGYDNVIPVIANTTINTIGGLIICQDAIYLLAKRRVRREEG